MKELSIKEKAKYYDESMNRAKKKLDACGSQDCDAARQIFRLFPELKESEDELTWLTKYIEEEAYSLSIDIRDSEDSVKLKKLQRSLAWLEKKGEQKPAWSEDDEEMYNTIANSLDRKKVERVWNTTEEEVNNWFKSIKDRVQPQPKQEWSEEDEDNFKHLMDEIVCLSNSRNSANRLYYDKLIKFLDELKNRAQPREEWCDKDKRMLDRLIAYFEKQVAFTDDDNPMYANWLKNLKDRYTWKPSDEQMEYLAKAITTLGNEGDNKTSAILYELRTDLKKLKG